MASILSTFASYASAAARLLSSSGGRGWHGEAENFAALRQMTRRLVRTEFQPEWLFRLAVDGAPSDFDLYVKEVTYSLADLSTDEEQLGSAAMTWPKGEQARRITVMVRDNVDRRVTKFLRSWASLAVRPDGTVGLPYGENGYVRDVSVYVQSPDGTETLDCRLEMYPSQIGDATVSRENGQWKEIPVTFVQFTGLETTIGTGSADTAADSA